MILLRPAPHTVVSWRFLLPNQSVVVKLHRAVFLNAWADQPCWVRGVIFVYATLTWYGFFGWLRFFTIFGKYAPAAAKEFGVSPAQQAVDLLGLAFLHGIPPQFYYSYALYRQPRQRWLNYVYTHELPHWHRTMAGRKDTATAIQLLSDKKRFAEEMARSGLPAVPASALLLRGDQIHEEDIFRKESFFIKPRFGSHGHGCHVLRYDHEAGAYQLAGKDTRAGEAAILNYLTEKTAREDFIVQPLLANHPHIEELCRPPGLVTIRLITGHDGRNPVAIGAVLEIPRSDSRTTWWLVGIDCETGTLLEQPDSLKILRREGQKEMPTDFAGKTVPCWPEALRICLEAHALVPEMVTVGWDVVIAPAGAVLLEGNVNWGVAPIQIFSGRPLLETRLREIWLARVSG